MKDVVCRTKYDAPRGTLRYQMEIRHFVKLFNLFFKAHEAVPWVPKSVFKSRQKRSYVSKYFCFGGIFVTKDYC